MAVFEWAVQSEEPTRQQLLKEMQIAGPTVDYIGRLFQTRDTIENAAARQAIIKVCAAGLIRMSRIEEYRTRVRPELDDAEAFERSFYVTCSACSGTGKTSVPCKACGGLGNCPAKNCVGGRVPVSGFGQSRVPSGRTLGGSSETGGYRKCLQCNGTGKCSECHGSGRLETVCSVCSGRGKVWNSGPAAAVFERAVADALQLLPAEAPPPSPSVAVPESPSEKGDSEPTENFSFPDRKVWFYAALIVLAAIGVGGLRLIRVTHG